ncbi:mercury resistance system transport protein MerF [Ferruginivarius sediminum]|uniref:Mercury resistance system transport protein MerF n=2 Tax=Ferruginivarius sediminum TaxID=2661937 RepID=A0A369TD14_9PROT|nr:mercury resistance system transport protein MerF [Ferruginivarius sediminum]
MESTRLLRTGVIGSLVTAVCCFTPLLVWGLPALGLAAWLGWIDYVLLPALSGFIVLIAIALWRRWSA